MKQKKKEKNMPSQPVEMINSNQNEIDNKYSLNFFRHHSFIWPAVALLFTIVHCLSFHFFSLSSFSISGTGDKERVLVIIITERGKNHFENC